MRISWEQITSGLRTLEKKISEGLKSCRDKMSQIANPMLNKINARYYKINENDLRNRCFAQKLLEGYQEELKDLQQVHDFNLNDLSDEGDEQLPKKYSVFRCQGIDIERLRGIYVEKQNLHHKEMDEIISLRDKGGKYKEKHEKLLKVIKKEVEKELHRVVKTEINPKIKKIKRDIAVQGILKMKQTQS